MAQAMAQRRGKAPSRRRAARSGKRGGRRPKTEYDKREIAAAVCKYFCQGYPVREIVAAVHEDYGITLNREEPYAIVRDVARRGQLRYEPPQHVVLQNRLRNAHPWLQDVQVVHTTVVRDVADEAAKTLVGLLQRYRKEKGRDQVHIGFAGGHTMRALARALARRLCEPSEHLPERVVFHALAAGFDPQHPTTDPNAFFGYFVNEPVMQVEPLFHGLSSLAIVNSEDVENLKKLPDIEQAFADVKKVDIVVTTATDWSDKHSALRTRMERSAQSMRTLEEERCVGDILWRPIAEHGPIEAETEIRALTLIELSELPKLIRGGTKVLLMLAPCGGKGCNLPKGRLLRDVLNMRDSLLTHLVVDSRSAGEMMRLSAPSPDL